MQLKLAQIQTLPQMDTMSVATCQNHSTKPSKLPFHNINTTPNEQPASINKDQTGSPIAIPDKRRNSEGENLYSPNENWKPDFTRKQSWNQEDLKRKFYASTLMPSGKEVLDKGFTEGAEETEDMAHGKDGKGGT